MGRSSGMEFWLLGNFSRSCRLLSRLLLSGLLFRRIVPGSRMLLRVQNSRLARSRSLSTLVCVSSRSSLSSSTGSISIYVQRSDGSDRNGSRFLWLHGSRLKLMVVFNCVLDGVRERIWFWLSWLQSMVILN